MLGLLIFVSIISLLSMVMNCVCYLQINKQLKEGWDGLGDGIGRYFEGKRIPIILATQKVERGCSCVQEEK